MAESADSRRRGLVVLIALAAMALAVSVGVLVTSGGGGSDGDDGRLTGPGETFTLDYPDSWSARPSSELAELGQQPLAVLDRDDDTALLTIRREPGTARDDVERFSRELDRELPKRFDDFQKGNADVVRLKAGAAFSYTFARTRAGSAHTIVLMPDLKDEGRGSYVMDGVVRAGENDAAAEMGEIIRSFDFPE